MIVRNVTTREGVQFEGVSFGFPSLSLLKELDKRETNGESKLETAQILLASCALGEWKEKIANNDGLFLALMSDESLTKDLLNFGYTNFTKPSANEQEGK
jgi:hypothetical protein